MLIQKDFPWKFEDIVLVPSNESHVIFVATKSLLSPSCYSQKAFRVFPLPLTSEMSPWHCWVRVFHFVCLWFLSSNHGSDTCPHSGAVSSITAEYTLSSTPSVLIFWRSVQCMLGTSGFIFWFSWPFFFFFCPPCPFLLFWENSLAQPANLFSCQLQCFCPLTENFTSIVKFFISNVSKAFLFMGAISFYFPLRILIIYVPFSCSACSINSASWM